MRPLLIFTITIFAIFLGACGGTANAPNTPANAATNTASNASANNPVAVTTPTPEQTTNNGPTLTPVFKAYCDAWVKNDEAALRKVYSADTIKEFEADMKVEKEKSLLKYLEMDKVSGNPCEVTNEQINGDKATARIRSDKYPNGIKILFVKEGGEWKMTNGLDAVTKSEGNANTAK